VWQLGDYLDHLAQPAEAVVAAYRDAISTFDRLIAAVPGETQYRDDAIDTRFDLAFVLQRIGRAEEANRIIDEAVALRRQAAQSGMPSARGELAAALAQQGLIRWRTERRDEAVLVRDEAEAILKKLDGAAETAAAPLTTLAEASARCARLFEQAGRVADAATAYLRAATLRERATRELSHEQRDQIRLRAAWGQSLADLARFHLRQGQPTQAADRCKDARAVYEQLAASFPMQPDSYAQLAYFLATAPVASLRDSARALQRAERAVDQSVHQNDPSSSFRARGIARYRLGDHAAALADLDRATLMRNGRVDAADLYFRAMVRAQLGNKEAARRDYDEARRLSLIRLTVPDDERWSELQQLREEAEAVLRAR
jgi:tetratricopeptide (TPR) repeat protein